MSYSPRVMIIGMDAADRNLINTWLKEGALPTLNKLLETGIHGTVENPPAVFVGSVWPSFYMAASPAKHGRYCYRQIVPGTYRTKKMDSKYVQGKPFWQSLSEAGKRVSIFDIPLVKLTKNINGIHITNWGSHDQPNRFHAWPSDVEEEIKRNFGESKIGSRCDLFKARHGIVQLRDELLKRIRYKTEIACRLLEKEQWDLFLTVFGDSHCIGHQGWFLHDTNHPQFDTALAKQLGDPIRDVYMELDSAIGRLLNHADKNTVVIVLASHSMGPHYSCTFLLEEVLRRLDEGGHSMAQKVQRLRSGAKWTRKMWRRIGGNKFKEVVRGMAEDWYDRVIARDRAVRRFFAVPNNDTYGAIRINLKGREVSGIVHPGREYDAVCEEISQNLMQLTDADNGRPLVKQVMRVEELYPGEETDGLPDLFVEWCNERLPSRVKSPLIGIMDSEYRGQRTGDHTNNGEGQFFVSGPVQFSGRDSHAISIMDFGPTAAHLLGVELKEVQGKPFLARNDDQISKDV